MTELVFGHDQIIGKWVADQLGYQGFAGNFMAAVGVMENGAIIGGTVFHNYYAKEGVVEMTSASIDPRWLSRKMIRTIFTYVFDFLQCQLVVMRISETNTRMLNIADRFKFDSYTIPRLRGKTEAEVICTFTDEQWLASPYRKHL